MKINKVMIQDTWAEAWDLEVVRLVLTAISEDVALGAAEQFVGAAGSSELGSRICGGIERMASPQETPDGRPGVIVALTMPPFERENFVRELALRVVLATLVPTCAVFDFMVEEAYAIEKLNLYELTSENWKGYETKEEIAGRKVCIVPTTTGQFVYEEEVSLSTEGVDGHFVCYAETEASSVLAVKAAKEAIKAVDGVSPMGYGLEAVFKLPEYCPALRERVKETKVPEGVKSVVNLLMFGATKELIKKAMKVAIEVAAKVPGVKEIGAMNFGGQFGRHNFDLHELLE